MLAMRILMLTNTFPPVVSGVARSIVAFDEEYRRLSHEVRIIAPEADQPLDDPPHVLRTPAIQHFNGSDFPLPVPSPVLVSSTMSEFRPDIVHAHHPFFMGNTAMRLARSREVPLVFTYHTMYDQYTHYAAAAESSAASKFVGSLAAGYANLCDAVIAPSQSVADLLRERGVETRIQIIPTGVDVPHFSKGDGRSFRDKQGIPTEALVVGYVGRLAPEKNLRFLAESVARFMKDEPRAHFLVVGGGAVEPEIREVFEMAGLANRLHLAGCCEGQELIDAYHALDLFAFASQSETQGMVLTEAMAAGKPVVAVAGPGVRDVVEDRVNGCLVASQDEEEFASALAWIAGRSNDEWASLISEAQNTADRFSMPRQARRALKLYEELLAELPHDDEGPTIWQRARLRIETEMTLWSNVAHAASQALEPTAEPTALSRSIA
jgi:glycosyltransferase involved in cell wall biosynthesis